MSVEVVHEDHIAIITITRPEARNAVNGAVAQGIEQALDDYEADDSLWVAIFDRPGPCVQCGRGPQRNCCRERSSAVDQERGFEAWFAVSVPNR